jgi:Na+/melibiose symporter-like transporter
MKREPLTINRSERIIASLFGLGMISIGPVLWILLPPGDGQLVALYAGAMFGLFGIVLLWWAYSA